MTYWGRSTTAGSSFGTGFQRAMGGTFVGTDQVLDGAEFWLSGNGTDSVRVAIYVGGTVDDPSGATLLEDLGQITPAATIGWVRANSSTNPTISANSVVWVYLHGTGATSTTATTDDTDTGDFQSARGRASFSSSSKLASEAPPATLPAASFSNFWYAWRLDYSAAGASGPTLDTVPATAYPGQSRTLAVSNAGATQGTGGITIGGVAQTVTSWSDTSITFTTVQGTNKYATSLTIELTTDGGDTASDTIELIVEPGTGGYVDVVSPETTDTSAFAYQAETAGGDPVATGDQFEWRYTGDPGDPTSMTVQADTLPSALDAEGDIEGRFWDATDSTWGSWYTFTASATDTTPDQFDLGANVTGAEPGATTQRTFVLAGIDSGETVSVTATGSATASPSTAQVGDTITVELTAGTFEAVVSGGVEIGGVSDSFSLTSRAAVLPTQDVALPDLSLGETDVVSIDLDTYFSGASSYTLTGIPADSGLSFSGSVLSGSVNKDDIAASPYTLTATAFSADGSINDAFSVTVVDDIGPVISVNSLTTTDTTPNLTGSAGDAVSLTLDVEGVDVVYSQTYNITPSAGSWSQLSEPLSLGSYTLTLNGEDAAGNAAVEQNATLSIVDELQKARGLKRMSLKIGMGI